MIATASSWAEAHDRVRALLLKGSLAGGRGDERSDLDLVVVTQTGGLGELWADRRRIAERLGQWLGGFDEVAWQAPHTFIGFYDGPVKVDFSYQEGKPHRDPWLRTGSSPSSIRRGLPSRCERSSLPSQTLLV